MDNLIPIKTIKALIILCLLPASLFAAEPQLETINFTENFENFANPERGFHRYTHLRGLTAGQVSGLRAQGQSLILGLAIVDDYIDKDFDTALFNELQAGFDVARNEGLKINFRLYYTAQSYADPPLQRMLDHINQLDGIFDANADVINVVEAGFIGPWGEWHSSTLGNPPAVSNMQAVLFELLSVLPQERMVSIRRPMFRRQIYGDNATLNTVNAFSGSNLSRTGYHNDAFVSSDTDLGTYVDPGWSRQDELAYAGNESRFTPFGGESSWHSPLHELTNCDNSTCELEMLRANYLNDGWYGPVLDRWESQGCLDEIKRRLGYRFVMRALEISEQVKPGGILHLVITMENVGFGSLFNPRDVELILQKGDTVYVADIDADPRRWEPGQTIEYDGYFRIPAQIAEGSWDVKLQLPDPANTLHDDPRYAIRLANDNAWEESTGCNILKQGLAISHSAPGSATDDPLFYEIEPPWTISGTVSGCTKVPIVLYRYTGCNTVEEVASAIPGDDGSYAFSELSQGYYKLAPSDNEMCSFNPECHNSLSIPQTNPASYDFTITCPACLCP